MTLSNGSTKVSLSPTHQRSCFVQGSQQSITAGVGSGLTGTPIGQGQSSPAGMQSGGTTMQATINIACEMYRITYGQLNSEDGNVPFTNEFREIELHQQCFGGTALNSSRGLRRMIEFQPVDIQTYASELVQFGGAPQWLAFNGGQYLALLASPKDLRATTEQQRTNGSSDTKGIFGRWAVKRVLDSAWDVMGAVEGTSDGLRALACWGDSRDSGAFERIGSIEDSSMRKTIASVAWRLDSSTPGEKLDNLTHSLPQVMPISSRLEQEQQQLQQSQQPQAPQAQRVPQTASTTTDLNIPLSQKAHAQPFRSSQEGTSGGGRAIFGGTQQLTGTGMGQQQQPSGLGISQEHQELELGLGIIELQNNLP
ncbi:hypothetical protein BJ742DRAFT_904004 [Cladochytrium replicatum]|nr:hypothetical protein BJ742DRAFT_904004 [Cladochytrium replicatum]